jgi:hypothetical protein
MNRPVDVRSVQAGGPLVEYEHAGLLAALGGEAPAERIGPWRRRYGAARFRASRMTGRECGESA